MTREEASCLCTLCTRGKKEHSSGFSLYMCDCRSKEWDDVVKEEKERIDLKQKEDGEFWFVLKNKKKLTEYKVYKYFFYIKLLILLSESAPSH